MTKQDILDKLDELMELLESNPDLTQAQRDYIMAEFKELEEALSRLK